MNNSIEDRLLELEAMTGFLHANNIALQTTLSASLATINQDPKTRAAFVVAMKAAAQGSYDHAIGQTWSDEMIAISRRGMAAFIGKDIAKECGLP